MMFALLQEQCKLQLERMVTANKAMMDATMECMNAILGGGGNSRSERDKENTPPFTNADRGGNNKAKKVRARRSFAPPATCSYSTNPTDAKS
jgi:hypothetical protein